MTQIFKTMSMSACSSKNAIFPGKLFIFFRLKVTFVSHTLLSWYNVDRSNDTHSSQRIFKSVHSWTVVVCKAVQNKTTKKKKKGHKGKLSSCLVYADLSSPQRVTNVCLTPLTLEKCNLYKKKLLRAKRSTSTENKRRQKI